MAETRGYDYVIVGAGSAGCVLAERLSADSAASVLLIEAGGWDRDPWIRMPLGWGRIMAKRLHDWGYDTEPEPALDGRIVEFARGKVIGGSSSINAMAYVRGHPDDYERWARGGLADLAYDKALPIFRKQERWEGGEDAFRGGSGPLDVRRATYADPLVEACLEAASSAGHPFTEDYNGRLQEGFGVLQSTIRHGRRCSAADAFLRPALRRPNLTVVTQAMVAEIGFEGDRARTVRYLRRGRRETVAAAHEIILSAGAVNSPQLLMLSGIGDPDALRTQGIATRVALKGVGANLQDHPSVAVEFARSGDGPFQRGMRIDRLARHMASGYLLGRGFMTDLPSGWTAFLRTASAQAAPDVQLIFRAVPLAAWPWAQPFRRPFADGFAIRAVVLRPQSRGSVRLRSASPSSLPVIRQNLLTTEADNATIRQGLEIVRDLAGRAALAPFIARELAPGADGWSGADLDGHIQRCAATAHHPAGTCRMGPETDADAVLDAEFRVRGVRGLRVVDASAMPDLVGGNINATVMMLAEVAARKIRVAAAC